MEISELLRCLEGSTFEVLRDLSDTDAVLRAVLTFSNSTGGILIIGVDEEHSVAGLEFPWHAEDMVATLIRDSISPMVNPGLETVTCGGKSILRVTVFPGAQPPYRLLEKKPTLTTAFSQKYEAVPKVFPRFGVGLGYDETPMPGLDSGALDIPGAIELFAPHRRLSARDLKNMRVLVDFEGKPVPTVGGVLLFGRGREEYFPDVWLQCGRFQGRNKAVILDTMEFREHLPLLPVRAMEFLRKHSLTSYHIEGVHREERSSLPLVALREGVINALVHADYSSKGSPVRLSVFDDRVEVENSGILPSGLTMPDILKGISVLRNQVIGRVFKELGLIEQWGSGIQRMLADCGRLGFPEPRFEEHGDRFRLVILIREDGSSKLPEPSLRLRRLLSEDSPDF